MLHCVYQLRDEISELLAKEGKETPEFKDPEFLDQLAYLIDIPGFLKKLNKKLQGRIQCVHALYE